MSDRESGVDRSLRVWQNFEHSECDTTDTPTIRNPFSGKDKLATFYY